EKNSAAPLDAGTMGVSADDNVDSRLENAFVELFQVVQGIERDRLLRTVDAGPLDFRNSLRPVIDIIVAANGNGRGKGSQAGQNIGAADVAGVNDQVHAFEQSQHLRP